jgi:hypothetical protein
MEIENVLAPQSCPRAAGMAARRASKLPAGRRERSTLMTMSTRRLA